MLAAVGLIGVILYPTQRAGFYAALSIMGSVAIAIIVGPRLIGGPALRMDAGGLDIIETWWRRRRYALADISGFTLQTPEPGARNAGPKAICRLHGGSLYLTGQNATVTLPDDMESSPAEVVAQLTAALAEYKNA